MTKKELEDKISELEKQLVELKGELEKEDSKMPVGEIWKPEENEEYYFNYFDGLTDYYRNEFDNEDTMLMQIGNCYHTREKAEFEANREKYTRLFRQYVEQHSEPLDWKNSNEKKYTLYYEYIGKKIKYDNFSVCRYFSTIYASSEEVLKEAVDFVGEENVKKYILEIGE